MPRLEIVFETHASTTDNEQGIATGWLPGELSATGRRQAAELGRRRRADGIDAVFCSDLARAVDTAAIAFRGTAIAIAPDSRLRECDYGELTGASVADVHARSTDHVDVPHPGGESWREATDRVADWLGEVRQAVIHRRVLVVGHQATRWGLERAIDGTDLTELVTAATAWQPGWTYVIG